MIDNQPHIIVEGPTTVEQSQSAQAPLLVLDTACDYGYRFHFQCESPAREHTLVSWQEGLEPEERPLPAGTRNGFILLAAVVMVLVLFNFRSLRKLVVFNADEMVNVRHGRDNVFDERPASLSFCQILMMGIFVLCSGFLLVGGLNIDSELTEITYRTMAIATAITACYVVFEAIACLAVGYTFSTAEGCREWMRGFFASTSLIGAAIFLPALIGVFYPTTVASMAVVAIIVFLIGKITFIIKGFRIFYDNLFSLIYFILYLCTLEIIPIILVLKSSELLLS